MKEILCICKVVSFDIKKSQNLSYLEKTVKIWPIMHVNSDIVRKVRLCLTPLPPF